MKKSAVLYHYPCPDGAFAALAAHLYFSATSLPALFFPNTVYNPISIQQLPLHEIDDLYLLDFVGPSGFVQQISSKISRFSPDQLPFNSPWFCFSSSSCSFFFVIFRVVILDHHETALKMLGGGSEGETLLGKNVNAVLDMERSGAMIAYDYFKEKLVGIPNQNLISEFNRLRRIFEYIEDADIWRWRLENSKAFSNGLKDLNIEFNVQLNPSLFKQVIFLHFLSQFSFLLLHMLIL